MKLALTSHPDHPPLAVRGVEVTILEAGGPWLVLRWKIDGATKLVVPSLAGKGRADGLWHTTCFEVFLRSGEGPGYSEFNLSPSEKWAAYDFSGYREGMAERPMPRHPDATMRKSTAIALFDGSLPMAGLPPLPWRANVSAVLEEEGGVKSYWALAHPAGKPDFHDPACFVLSLGPREAA